MPDHFILADIVRRFLPELKRSHNLSPQQASSCQNIVNCHTAKLGGLNYVCQDCAHHYPLYHSCRHRHCPQCQQQASERWVEQRMHDTLPVIYFHLVFTLPHELNTWAQLHPEVMYHRLFQCAWQTLNDYSQHNRQLQGQLGMTAVLHTWGQNLNQHIHLHCLIPGGAIVDNRGYRACRREYLYPHRALARLFRGKMVSALRSAWSAGQLQRITQAQAVDALFDALMKKDWVIHTKPHLEAPETVVRYLARYTHRTAISLSRIVAMDDTQVRFTWKDYRDDQHKTMTLPGDEFLRRFLLHILPKGFMRIRHYGYLANRVRVKQLDKIRHWLAGANNARETVMPGALSSQAAIPEPPMTCPNCNTGTLYLAGIIPSDKERRRCRVN